MLSIKLKNGRDKPIRRGHMWVMSGAVSEQNKRGEPGELCEVYSDSGALLGTGYFNPHSTIRVRLLTTGSEGFSIHVLERRIEQAIELRQILFSDASTDSYRLIYSEGDFLPGLIVDKYQEGLSLQIFTAGIEQYRTEIIKILKDRLHPSFIFERSDADERKREGLEPYVELQHGTMPDPLIITENGLRFRVDLASGQKSGYFFDQRLNRLLAKQYAYGRTVCDCFAYSGGFSVYTLSGGATHVHIIDTSKKALEWAHENIVRNSFSENVTIIDDNVFKFLRRTEDKYDMIVLDPPKFAKHSKDVQRAARGYKDINLAALHRLQPGGILFTFSCSHAIDSDLFRKIVFGAVADSGRSARILHFLSAGPDHPINIAQRESEYLKGLVLCVE